MRAPNDLADAVFADTLFRVGRAYGMTADRSVYRRGRITGIFTGNASSPDCSRLST